MSGQDVVDKFWKDFSNEKPSKVTKILPKSLYADILPLQSVSSLRGNTANESYETAAEECREKVAQIARECRRKNEKFSDEDFFSRYLHAKKS